MKDERSIISERRMIQYIPGGIFRASFKFGIGDKLREKIEGVKRDETFFSALVGAHMKEYRNKWQTTAGQSQLG